MWACQKLLSPSVVFQGKYRRKPLVIRVFAPMLVDPDSVSFQVAPGTAVCSVEFDGIPDETLSSTYGADSLQALQQEGGSSLS